jgi:hypothetical protein
MTDNRADQRCLACYAYGTAGGLPDRSAMSFSTRSMCSAGMSGQRRSQHAPRTLAHGLIEHRRRMLARRLIGHYSQIGAPSSPAVQRQRSLVKVNEEGTSRPRAGGRSTGTGHVSERRRTLAAVHQPRGPSVLQPLTWR